MPQKFEADALLKDFRKGYDYLNYVEYNKRYEKKLLQGTNQIKNNS